MIQQKKDQRDKSSLLFPCLFPIKIMGEKHETLRAEVVEITRKHAPGFIESMLTERESRHGTYLSLTVTINATSQAQLDALYQELTHHPRVKVVL